jgi:hypothetical protein
VNCYDDTESEIDEQVWSNGAMTTTGKLMHSEKNMSQCHFVDYKLHMDRTDTKPGSLWRELGDCLHQALEQPNKKMEFQHVGL